MRRWSQRRRKARRGLRPLSCSRGLLAALTDEIGLSPGSAAAMTSQAIARGHGHSVCVLLNWILDKVLVQRNMASLPPPDYSTLIGAAEVEEILGGEDDEEDNGGGVAEDDVLGGGLDSDDENTPGGKAWEQTGNKKGRSAGSGENDREEFYLGGIRRGPDADVTAPVLPVRRGQHVSRLCRARCRR